MAIFLSLLTAALYGAGDFFGGLSSRSVRVIQVVAVSHLLGLIGVVAIAPILADAFTWRDAGLGAVGGLCGGVGVGLLYRRLAIGPMSVVAPLTAITSAAVPAIWGTATGESLSALAWTGVVLALVAIGLVSAVTGDGGRTVDAATVFESLLSGAGFGSFFILLDATEGATAPWPVAASRLTTAVLLIGFLAVTRQQIRPRHAPTLGLVALVGLFDTGSNITFLYATDQGLLTLVAVLSALYPIATVILARFVLRERMSKPQVSGFVLAMAATGLIAAG